MLKAALIITGIIVAIVIVLYIAGVIACMKMRYEDELLDYEGKTMTGRENRPDPEKVFGAIARILNARDETAKVRLVSVRRADDDERKAG